MSTMADSTPGPLPPARGVWLVARREINARVRSRSFVISTIAVLLVLGGLIGLQALLAGQAGSLTVGLYGQASSLVEPLQTSARELGKQVETTTVRSPEDGQRQIQSGRLDALVTGAPGALHVVVKKHIDPGLQTTLDGMVRQQVLNAQLAGAGLDVRQVQQTLGNAKVDVTTLEPQDPFYPVRIGIGILFVVLLFMSIQLYGQAVAQGVVEEKSSRVVEILLSTMRPWQLMLGKVLGVGAAGLAQIVIIVGVAVAGVTASGLLTLPPGTAGIVIWGVIWYLLGFFLFASLLAAAASLVSRQEELASVVTPVTMLLLVPYVVGFSQLTSNPDSKLIEILSMIPPFGPMLMPSRIALEVAPGWEIALSLLLTILALAGAIWLGSRIYANAVLRTGARVKLKDALRSR